MPALSAENFLPPPREALERTDERTSGPTGPLDLARRKFIYRSLTEERTRGGPPSASTSTFNP